MDKDLDEFLVRNHRDYVFEQKEHYLSKHTDVQVFEAGASSSGCQRMDNNAFIQFLKDSRSPLIPQEPRFRIIFIPDTLNETDKLQLTPAAFELLLNRFNICSRFAGLIHLQTQPSRRLEYDEKTKKLNRIQYVYSSVLRSLSAAENPKDATKRILDWQRFVAWTGYDVASGNTTMVILRCPKDTQERLLSMIGDEAHCQRQMLRYPMLVHAFFAEDFYVRAKYFAKNFAAPLYGLELDLGHSAAEYTQRARRFMLMARQMGNVRIDYDIYLGSLRLLLEVFELIKHSGPPVGTSEEEWSDIHREFDNSVFELKVRDFELTKQYGELYERRSMIGNTECTALVNQREVEISKVMSAESTVIARSSYRDGQALRIIQYLGLVFLPLSLCTSIFGMGFFSTSPNPADIRQSIFSVSSKWWWFLALCIPFTIAVLLLALASTRWSQRVQDVRRQSDLNDLEKLQSYEMAADG